MKRFLENKGAIASLALLYTGSLFAAEERPNIIFILTDDQPFQLLGANGHPVVKTPNLDKLAKEGVRFTNAHVSTAISTPSRTCMLTGRFERSHGVNFNSETSLSPEAWSECYPNVLRASGYYTGYVGKNHTPIGPDAYKTGLMEESYDYWYGGHEHLSFYPKTRHQIFKGAKSDTQIEVLVEGMMDFLNPNERSLAGALHFMGSRPKEQPFFLNVCFNLPHDAGTSTMKQLESDSELYKSAYRDVEMPLPENYIAKKDIKTPKLPAHVLRVEDRQTGYDWVDTPEALRERLIRQCQTVTGIDNLVGKLLAELKKQKIDKNTIIIFSSDHGVFSGQYGLGGKALCYELCTKVPLIIFDPRTKVAKADKVNDELVLSIDYAQTILEYAGTKAPASYQGKSLVPMMEGKEEKVRDYLFSENLWATPFGNPPCEAVQTKEWKYIRYYKNPMLSARTIETLRKQMNMPPNTVYRENNSFLQYRTYVEQRLNGEEPIYEELYNLKNDPWEAKNLIGEAQYKELVAKMRVECDKQLRYARGEGNPRVCITSPKHDKQTLK